MKTAGVHSWAAFRRPRAFHRRRVSFGQKKYDDGASDSEIKIGHTCPYSGPASAYGVNGKAIVAFWDMINDKGGINGRKVKFISSTTATSRPRRSR